MGLSNLIRAANRDLLITPRIELFLTEHGVDFDVPVEVLSWAANEIANGGGPRPGWLRSSGIHQCPRRQVYAYQDTPALPHDNGLSLIFSDGRYRHLRWQVMLLTAGILTHVEEPWRVPDLRMSGTLDGVNEPEKWGFELKGAHDYAFRSISTFDEPKPEHTMQVDCYFIGRPDLERFSLVYENKNTNAYREFVIERDDERIQRTRDHIDYLNSFLNSGSMPPVLDECKDRSGAYHRCPYRETCVPKTIRINR